MVKKSLRKNTFREIRDSFGRFIAILAIVALGVGFYAGLQVTKPAMVKTGDEYFRDNSLYDLRFISTLGLYDEDVEELSRLSYVRKCEGAFSKDVLVTGSDAQTSVAKIHSISDTINCITLVEGRLPENTGECVVDSRWISPSSIGEKFVISESNSQETLDMFDSRELTIVGLVKSVYYVNFERGNTTLGSGKLAGFIYVLPEAFTCDYFTEVFAVTDASEKFIYTDAYDDLIDEEVDDAESVLEKLANDRYDDLYSEAQDKIDDARKDIENGKLDLEDAEKKIADGKGEIEKNLQKIEDGEKEILDNIKKLEDAESELAGQEKDLKKAKDEISKAKKQLKAMKAYMSSAEYKAQKAVLDASEKEIENGEKEIEKARIEIEDGYREIEDAKAELEDARVKITDAEKEIEDAEAEVSDARVKIEDGEAKLKDAEDELADFERPDTYVLTRSTNIGYACFENDSSIVEGIGKVFPIFFFLVAALVCMTTMNRMVEEQRTQIGIMKALGYSESSIMGKYLFYSGSAAIIGGAAGFAAGSKLFPWVIWMAYNIMYTMKDIVFLFDLKLAIVSLIVALLCSVGATYVTLNKELKSQSADLIRPKAPANGKRVFLEKIGFIWNRLKFTHKVSLRNVFRYKKRFFMMILGVGGCYGLLITGFGIKDSIADVCDCQFKQIMNYGMTVTFKDGTDVHNRQEFEKIATESGAFLYTETKTVDVDFDNKVKSATLVVYSDYEGGTRDGEFVNFLGKDDRRIPFPSKGEAIITQKMADMLGVSLGDMVILRDPDLNEIPVKVSGIMRNYVYNWAYINYDTYMAQMGHFPDYNTAFVQTIGAGYELSAAIGNLDYVSSVSVTDEMSVRIDNMMESLNMVVLLVISCAAALAFIVMYNLTNINITERLREIATLKVLGFYPNETAIYVFRENFLLTGIGCVVGLFMGYALHRYVMYNINVEVVTFDTKILPISYVYGVLLTFAFAFLVDFALFFKLEKIKMAESLKSVE